MTMHRILVATLTAFSASLPLLAAAAGNPTAYVYTNDDQYTNTVTEFAVGSDGTLTNAGQFLTGGYGCGGGYYAANRVSGGKSRTLGDYLMASNCSSSTLSVFTGAKTGALTLNTTLAGEYGDTSIVGSGSCFVVGYATSGNIATYTVPDFTKVSTLTGLVLLDGMATKTIGGTTYVVAALPYSTEISVMTLNPNSWALTYSGNIMSFGGHPTGVSFSPNGSVLYVGNANLTETIVEAFAFPAGTPLDGSPYYYSSGVNSNTVVATEKCLFVANQQSAGVSAIPLITDGVPGSTATLYPAGNGGTPVGMALNPRTQQLLVASGTDNTVTDLQIGSGCTLTESATGPVPTGATDGLLRSITLTQ